MNATVEAILGTRTTTLEPEPNGPRLIPRLADLLDEIAHFITWHERLPIPTLSVLIALWIAMTFCYKRFRYAGFLGLRSATPRCGKTRLLRIISMLAAEHPRIAVSPTSASLFRSPRRVLILDEVDRLKNSDRETYGDVVAVLNAAFELGGCVDRVEKTKNGFEVREYNVYRPVALAGINCLADTLADRIFQICLERSPERLPRLNERTAEELTTQLAEGLAAWTEEHGGQIEATYEGLPDEVLGLEGYDDRLQDIAEPLVVLATLADAERPEGPAVLPRLLDALRAAAERREASGRERELVAFLEIAEDRLGAQSEAFVKSADLLAVCAEREELSHIETGRALAGFLKHFDLHPGFDSTKSARGYRITRDWLNKWQARYGGRRGAA